jgi:hypothetical protein
MMGFIYMMHIRRRLLAAGAITACLYLSFWLVTASVGAESVRLSVVKRMNPPPGLTDVSNEAGRANSPGSYFCRTTAIAPFVVRMEFAYNCGVLCGISGTYLFFWSPGFTRQLGVLSRGWS